MGIRNLFEALFSVLKSGPKPKPAGIPTPGPLPGQLPTAPGKPAKLPPIGSRILRKGIENDSLVEALQRRLVEIGYHDLNVDGDFGEVTDKAVRAFQLARNLDPDGEVGPGTWAQLARADAAATLPPLLPPSTAKHGEAPDWYKSAEKEIGFREVGNNRGIEKLIARAGVGSLGDPWCAIFVNGEVRMAGFAGSNSAMARSFETSKNFIKLPGPALGAIATMWRGSPSAGTGHVFFYDGESSLGIRGIGGNEVDMVKRSFHPRNRVVDYYWPKDAPLPAKIGPIQVNSAGATVNTKET